MPRVIIRYQDLHARGIVRNRVQLKNLQTKYGFPAGFMLSPYARAWYEDEVEAWLKGRPTKMDDRLLRGVGKRGREGAVA